MAVPRGASATNAMVPAENSPAGVRHHDDAGMANVDDPGPASTGRRPVRWWMGGAGVRPAIVSRIRSSPVNPSTEGSEYPPRTGSCQMGMVAAPVSATVASLAAPRRPTARTLRAGLPFGPEQPHEDHVVSPPVSCEVLPQPALLREAEPPIQLLRAVVVAEHIEPDAVQV